MKNFASFNDLDGLPKIVNTDYIVFITTGLDPREPTQITMYDGSSFQLHRSEGSKLIQQLNRCCEGEDGGQPKGSSTGDPASGSTHDPNQPHNPDPTHEPRPRPRPQGRTLAKTGTRKRAT